MRNAVKTCAGAIGTILALVINEVPASAVEFAIVGARAAGMGGAGVAVTSDAYATYWNPAGLAMSKGVDVLLGASVQGVDRLGLKQTLNDLKNFNGNDFSQANINYANSIASRFNQPGASISAIAAGGLYVKGSYGDHAFGLNISDVATGGMYTSVPVTVGTAGIVSIAGQMAVNGLEARQAVASYAYSFLDRKLAFGVSGKFIQGAAYTGTAFIQGGNNITFSHNLGTPALSTAFSLDAGALYRPTEWLRVGLVAKDLTQPTFRTPIGTEFKLTSQVRAGAAVNPYRSMTVTVDADVIANHTLVPGVKSQVVAIGAEQALLSDRLFVRLGAYKNTVDTHSYITPTAGFGMRFGAFVFDIGGGYDFRSSGALGSFTLGMTF